MPFPSIYDVGYSYSGFAAGLGNGSFPGSQLDADLAGLSDGQASIRAFLMRGFNAQGGLANGSVASDALHPSLSVGFSLRGAWMPDTDYLAGDGVVWAETFYKARLSHTSADSTRPDLGTTTWEFLFAFSAIAITDGSIVPAHLAADEGEAFRAKIGAASVEQAEAAGSSAIDTVRGGAPANFDTLAKLAAGKMNTDGGNATSAFLANLKWLSKGIGEFYAVNDAMAGVDIPPTDNAAFRFIKLTASDAYNDGVLTSQSVTGSAPLVSATAVISLAGSPLNSQTVRLLNTERRFLRAGAAGTVENDQMQQITGSVGPTSGTGVYGSSGLADNDAGALRFDQIGTMAQTGAGSTAAYYRLLFDSATSPNARAGTETRSKNMGVTFYMRVK